jgi:Ca2+-binding RTX toxin-like protein
VQGDLVHLLGGPHVGAGGDSLVAHRVNFLAYGPTLLDRSGIFAHWITIPEYFDASLSPVVPYAPVYPDVALAQSIAANFSRLGNTDGSVTSNAEATDRLALFLLASGVAFGVNTLALASELAGIPFDRNILATKLTESVDGVNQGWAFVMKAADAAGKNVADLSIRFATAYVDALNNIVIAAVQTQNFVSNLVLNLLTDTARGLGNAFTELTAKATGVVFDLGRTLSFPEFNLFEQAYAAELRDGTLSPALIPALEQAKAIVDSAGELIAIAEGHPANPFDPPGVDPDTIPLPTDTLNEGYAKSFTVFLPYAADVGGQAIRLTLQGGAADTFTVMAEGNPITPQNGVFTLTVPEGQREIGFALQATDVVADAALSLTAALVDASGTVTHLEHGEANITLVNGVAIDYDSRPVVTLNGTEGDDFLLPGGNINYIIHGNGGTDVIEPGNPGFGNDRLFGDAGNDLLQGGRGYDVLDGGTGSDDLEGDSDNDVLLGQAGDDLLLGDDSVTPTRPVGNDNLDGGDGADRLYGGLGDDVLTGGSGDDRLYGDNVPPDPGLVISRYDAVGGNDRLDGGPGNDLLQGDGGDDVLMGGSDNDLLFGDDSANPTTVAGNDFLDGGDGVDELQGGGGGDVLYGGTGNDLLFGDDPNAPSIVGGSDFLDGEDGDDQLQGGGGDDVLVGGIGNDLLFGDDPNAPSVVGHDVLYGGDGDDELQGGQGNDLLYGGDGSDTLFGDSTAADPNPTVGGNDLLDGGAGNDFLFGDAGTDELLGGDGADQLTGGLGDDFLDGEAGQDTYVFNFGDGHDVITDTALPGEGNVLSFGSGISLANLTLTPDTAQHTLTIQVGAGGDTITLEDFDLNNVDGSLVVQTLSFTDIGAVSLASQLPLPEGRVNGTTTDDIITTGTGDDVVQAFAGNDSLNAGAGADVLIGGAGTDTLIGGAGNDVYVFSLGDGVDTIYDDTTGGDTNTLVFGDGITTNDLTLGLGSLLIRVGSSGDVIHIPNFNPNDAYGTHAIDSFQFADGTVLTYSQLIDRGFDLTGTAGADTITGTNAVDRITGLAGNDVITSGAGDDVLDGGPGADNMAGGPGNDTYIVDDPGDTVTETWFEGTDVVLSSISYSLPSVQNGLIVENLTLTGTAAINGTGNTLDNVLTGNSAPNVLAGWLGNDTYVVDPTDTVIENPSEGIDTIQIAISYTLGPNLENLTLLGTAAINGTGNAYNNVLTGNSAANVLTGGLGNDTYVVDASDTVIENPDEGIDTVVADFTYTLVGTNLENLTLTGTAAINGTGNDFPNVLIGNSAANILDGGLGADTMSGGAGDDTYIVDPFSFDTVTEALNAGTDTVLSAASFTLPANVENLTLTGAAWIDGGGNALNNVLVGNSGNNQLGGGAGNDLYLFGRGSGRDTITEYDPTPGNVDTLRFAADVLPGDVTVRGDLNNVYLSINGTTDQVTLQYWVAYDTNQVERVEFADGTVWDVNTLWSKISIPTENADVLVGTDGDDVINGLGGDDQLYGRGGNDTLDGGSGNDSLYGSTGNDTLQGGSGYDSLNGGSGNDTLDGGTDNDWLYGEAGNDLYVFSPGTGQDQVYDYDPTPGNVDTIRFAAGVLPGDVTVRANENNELVVTITGSADQLKVGNWFSVTNDDYKVERVEFADGTVWDVGTLYVKADAGTEGPDVLIGSAGNDVLTGLGGNDKLYGRDGNDILDGGAGDDTLDGGKGNDVYLFGRGSGQDVLSDWDNTPGNLDTVRFAADVLPADVTVRGDLYHLYLTINGTSDKLELYSWFDSSDVYKIERVEFADGTVWDVPTLWAKAEAGTEQADILFGTAGNDVLNGLGGDDQLYGNLGDDTLSGGSGDDRLEGGAGNDTLDGGSGKDTLIGGNGDDTYVFGRGYGTDSITESGPSGFDTVRMAPGILPADVTLLRNGNNLMLSVDQSSTQLTVGGFFSTGSGDTKIEQITFGDGTVWDAQAITAHTISGTPNAMVGTAGNDTFIVDNTLDTVTEGQNQGTDTIQSSVTYTLPNNVENLTLTGYFNLNGTGNVLDNILIGNGSDNVLDGGDSPGYPRGGGRDTLRGGPGDDTYFIRGEIADQVIEVFGEGIDTVVVNASTGWSVFPFVPENYHYSLPDNVENLTLQSSYKLQDGSGPVFRLATGNALDNVIMGDPGGLTILDGGAGADTLIGGGTSGNDFGNIFVVDNPGDTVIQQNQTFNPDTVQSSITYTLGTNLENLTLTGTAVINGTGNDLNNILTGNTAANVLNGQAGDDTLQGGSGSDTYLFGRGSGHDTILESDVTGTDVDTIQLGALVAPNQVILQTNPQDDLLLSIAGTSDQLTVSSFFSSPGAMVEQIVFADGTIWDSATILSMTPGVTLTGTSGPDTLVGTNASDVLNGLGGDDLLDGRGGNDTMNGGTGNDTYIVGPGDTVNENLNEGTDTVQSSVTYTLADNVENLTLTGTAGINGTGNALDNVLTGNSGDNVLDGSAGADMMAGGLGNDTYILGGGDTVIENPNEGTDTVVTDVTYILGTDLENLILTGTAAINGTGNTVNNVLTGNSAANVLNGMAGADTMIGGAGDDSYIVDNAGDTVTENANEGTDTVQSASTYTLGPNVEALVLTGTAAINGTGNALNNTLTGNSAANILDGGAGEDTLIGGAGNDTYIVENAGDTVIENANEGTDTVQTSASYTLSTNVENLTLTGTAAINGTGNVLNNVLTGNSGANVLDGGAGADSMVGGGGNDTYIVDNTGDTVTEGSGAGTDTVQSSVTLTLGTNVENLTLIGAAAINGTGNTLNNVLTGNSAANVLNGMTGADAMSGGAGDDTYVVDNAGDTVTELANEGTDTVQSSVTYTLAANVENLVLTGTTSVNATGNGLNNTLTGNSGANVLDGGPGVDSMAGGAGNDTYIVENAGDTVTEGSGAGTDTVQSAISYTLGANLENLTLTGTAAITGTGNTLNNTVTGNSGANILDGGAGADAMSGGAGDDTYLVDNTGDTVTEGAGAGTDTVQSSVTFTLGVNVENLILTGTAAINGTGNTLNNVLTGNSAANVLNGGTGADSMTGGVGDDTYVVDNAGDTVTELANQGTDTVQSSVAYTLAANVENLTLTGTGAISGTGNTLNNVLTGNSGANVLTGGAGNDTYIVGTGDTVVEAANEGTDTVQSAVTFTLGANVENLILTGTSSINGTGNGLNNTLTGNSGANILDGGAGADTMAGGAGNDTYIVDNVGDSITELASAGTDTVQSGITYSLGVNLENLTLTGTAALNGTGNTVNNTLTGNSAANVLDGGAGADAMAGGAGDDTYIVDNTSDTVTEAAGAGTDTVQSSVTFTLGTNVENLTLTGTSAINGTGNTLANILSGNSANNILTGGAGNDTYLFSRGGGQDRIVDSDATAGNSDKVLFASGINPLDLVLSRQVNDLRLAIHGSPDQITVQNWYGGSTNQTETIQAGDGKVLLNSAVDQLIQAMAAFCTDNGGITWDQAIDQHPQEVQNILLAPGNWH